MPQKCDEPLEQSCRASAPIRAVAHFDSESSGARAAKCYCGGRGQHDPAHSKWGRHCCRPHSHRSVDGPSAHDASGEPLASFAFRGHAWRPMSSLSLPASCDRRARDLSPALAPASGFRSGLLLRPSSGRSHQSFASAPLLLPRLSSLYLPPVAAAVGLRRSAASAFRPGSWPVRCHRVAPILELS